MSVQSHAALSMMLAGAGWMIPYSMAWGALNFPPIPVLQDHFRYDKSFLSPLCGNKTLKKVAVSISDDGSLRMHFSCSPKVLNP